MSDNRAKSNHGLKTLYDLIQLLKIVTTQTS